MITSTYNVKLPEDGDKGQVVFDALNSNFTILRDHDHDGSDSGKITSSSLTKNTITLPAVSWTATGSTNGYKQTVTLSGAYTLANCALKFLVASGANQYKVVYPTIIPVSVTQFEVVVNDSTLELQLLCV